MPRYDAELKARLLAEAEAAIEKLLAERVAPEQASLADIERVVRAAGKRLEQTLTTELVNESARQPGPWPTCPQCGGKLKNKGKRSRRLVTETGEVELGRTYYHCAACGQGFFPPG